MDIACPLCNHRPIKYNSEILSIPYFDEVLSTLIQCDKCNYRYSDILITNQNLPMEYTFKITCENDMNVRVIRSSTATIELPELGIKIEPGKNSEAFVSNIEGVLVRAIDVIKQIDRFTKSKKQKLKAEKLLKHIEDLRNGLAEATVIIKDPMGNSTIVSKKAKKRELTLEEIKSLETGMVILELINEKNKK